MGRRRGRASHWKERCEGGVSHALPPYSRRRNFTLAAQRVNPHSASRPSVSRITARDD